MPIISKTLRSTILLSMLLGLFINISYAACPDCCPGQETCGIKYCDDSAGRYVCRDGSYSTCYCTRHAVMDLQRIHGCCLWQGGIFIVSPEGLVICNNGGISEICSYKPTMPSHSQM